AGDEPSYGQTSEASKTSEVFSHAGAVGMPGKNARGQTSEVSKTSEVYSRKVRLLCAGIDTGGWQHRLVNGTFVGGIASPSRAAVLSRGNAGDARRHWAFRAPVRPGLPPVHNAAWVRNAIDRFILA